MTVIQRGFRSKLDKFFSLNQDLRITLAIRGRSVYDFTCFGVDADGRLSDDRYMVFYNQLQSPDREISLQIFPAESVFTVNLQRLPASIDKLVFTASIDGQGVMSEIDAFNISIMQGQSVTANLESALFGKEKAVIALEFYRKDGWRMNLVGQGFREGLSALLKYYGGTEITESAPQPTLPPPQAKPAAPRKVSLEKRLEAEAPALVSLAKPIRITLEKKHLTDVQARVALVLDASGSMYEAYYKGTVQQIVNRILPLAVQFDDDGELDLWIFAGRVKRMESANLRNYKNIVPTNPDVLKLNAADNNEPLVMEEVISYYQNTELPAYVIFISDGGIYYDHQIKKLLIKSSILPIFWQFVGIAGSGYGVLEELDTMSGRYIDNANFFALDDFNSVSNQELYDRLLNEFPDWLKQAKAKGIFDPAVRASLQADRKARKQKRKGKKGPASSKSPSSWLGGDTLYRQFNSYKNKTVTVKGRVFGVEQRQFRIFLYNEDGSDSNKHVVINANPFDLGIVDNDTVIVRGVVKEELFYSKNIEISLSDLQRIE